MGSALTTPGPRQATVRSVSTRGVPVGPYPGQVDPVDYERLRRRVLWKLPTGLYLLGTRAGERRNLMTLNWAVQVSVDPEHVRGVGRDLGVEPRAFGGGALFLGSPSLPGTTRKSCASSSSQPYTTRKARTLTGFAYRDGLSGTPIPQFAIGYLDCGLRQVVDLGSHSLFVGEVLDAGFAPGRRRSRFFAWRTHV